MTTQIKQDEVLYIILMEVCTNYLPYLDMMRILTNFSFFL